MQNKTTAKKIGIILFLLCFVLFTPLPIYKIYAQSSNAGFVPGNIWYSIDPFEEGDKIKIYTLIFNPDERELSGTVIFFDNSVFLGKKDFIAPAKGVKDVSIDWTVTAGEHKIFGKIENSKFLLSKGKYEEVYLAENKTEESVRTVSKKVIINVKSESRPESVGTKNIEKIIGENTPEFLAKPIILTTNVIEGLRSDMGVASKNKKEEIQGQIKALNDAKISSASKIEVNPYTKNLSIGVNKFLKPFKYMELFLLTLFSFVFNNKFIFYTILAFIIFLLLRYIWHFVF